MLYSGVAGFGVGVSPNGTVAVDYASEPYAPIMTASAPNYTPTCCGQPTAGMQPLPPATSPLSPVPFNPYQPSGGVAGTVPIDLTGVAAVPTNSTPGALVGNGCSCSSFAGWPWWVWLVIGIGAAALIRRG